MLRFWTVTKESDECFAHDARTQTLNNMRPAPRRIGEEENP